MEYPPKEIEEETSEDICTEMYFEPFLFFEEGGKEGVGSNSASLHLVILPIQNLQPEMPPQMLEVLKARLNKNSQVPTENLQMTCGLGR